MSGFATIQADICNSCSLESLSVWRIRLRCFSTVDKEMPSVSSSTNFLISFGIFFTSNISLKLFASFLSLISISWFRLKLLEFTSDAYETYVYDGQNKKVFLPGYRVDAITDAAINFIKLNQKKPFFLFVSLIEPHHQNNTDDYPPPIGYREKYTGKWSPPDLSSLVGSSPRHLGG